MATQTPHQDPDIFGALAHPIRLTIMRSAGRPFSPKDMADKLGDVSLQLVSYHVRILRDAGLLHLTGTEPRRGALQHYYQASPDASARLASVGKTIAKLGDDLATKPKPRKRAAKAKA
jgi:DNA-binding transcriptional ArsR family regulator